MRGDPGPGPRVDLAADGVAAAQAAAQGAADAGGVAHGRSQAQVLRARREQGLTADFFLISFVQKLILYHGSMIPVVIKDKERPSMPQSSLPFLVSHAHRHRPYWNFSRGKLDRDAETWKLAVSRQSW